jgi:predicted nucleic acid-binding protein
MKIFLDANIVIDFLDNASYESKLATEVFRIIRLSKNQVYLSPTTFAIACYKFTKLIQNKNRVNKVLTEFFEQFLFTTENNLIMQNVLKSQFPDLEDALQYFSAIDSKIEVIITKNKKDFKKAQDIIVMHPAEFVELYYK